MKPPLLQQGQKEQLVLSVQAASFIFQLLLHIPGLPRLLSKDFENGASHNFLSSEILSAQSKGLCCLSVDGFVYRHSLPAATQIL